MTLLKFRVSTQLNTAALCGLLALGMGQAASAKTWCVDPGGANSCSTTISAAVKAASAGDTINIGPGQYNESVLVDKALALIGSGSDATVINARGLANGIYVDGLDNGGLMSVTITGLTIMNANYEGILLTNTSYSFITKNHVASNDQSLDYADATCAGLPVFETNEAEDCGEGIHLVGVHHTMVANNIVELNSGGILLSDETGATFENRILSNSVHDNPLDCGITLASHPPSPQASSKLPYGVFNNSIIGNNSTGNGVVGAGAGIGVFAPGPGNLAFGNQIIGNIAMNNGIPGISVHNHAAPPGAPPSNLNDIVIIGNYIAGNGADDADATTPGTTGINIYGVAPSYATQILENTIQNEEFGIVMHNPGAMQVHLNNLPATGTGILNMGSGSIDASMNFYGCAGGPGTTGCSAVSGPQVSAAPALDAPVATAPTGRGSKAGQ